MKKIEGSSAQKIEGSSSVFLGLNAYKHFDVRFKFFLKTKSLDLLGCSCANAKAGNQKAEKPNGKNPKVKFCCLWICNFQISDNWLLWFQIQISKTPIGGINNSGFGISETRGFCVLEMDISGFR